jgi:hypothetical protein
MKNIFRKILLFAVVLGLIAVGQSAYGGGGYSSPTAPSTSTDNQRRRPTRAAVDRNPDYCRATFSFAPARRFFPVKREAPDSARSRIPNSILRSIRN